jgi:hypothetical protein
MKNKLPPFSKKFIEEVINGGMLPDILLLDLDDDEYCSMIFSNE